MINSFKNFIIVLFVSTTLIYSGNCFECQANADWNIYKKQCICNDGYHLDNSGNIAAKKPATQSTTLYHYVAALSVDQNADENGLMNQNSCSMTQENQQNPWWKVDLGEENLITKVAIINRMDCCSERLENFKIHVGNDPIISNNPSCSGDSLLHTFQGKKYFDCPLRGRYVGVQIYGVGTLQLCEVQVFSEKCVKNYSPNEIQDCTGKNMCNAFSYFVGEQNAAQGKQAYQSSNYSSAFAMNANDGNYQCGSWTQCAHTNKDYQPWWYVDLGSEKYVFAVNIVNRLDCCGWRLTNFKIHVGNDPNISNNPSCGNTLLGQFEKSKEFDCGLSGRYVGIKLYNQTTYINICEVQVKTGGCVCYDEAFVQNGECVASCGSNYFVTVGSKICQPCDSSCLTCSGPSQSECLSCDSSMFLKNNQCVSTCDNGFYADASQVCQSCYSSCLTCSGPSSTQCQSCPSNYFLQQGQCVDDCGNEKYLDLTTQTCKSCNYSTNWISTSPSIPKSWCATNCFVPGTKTLVNFCTNSYGINQICKCQCTSSSSNIILGTQSSPWTSCQ